jgi:putative ABC transport system permease protein
VLGLAVRGLAARKMRALTTTLAVLLGVALMSGTYILTDTINKSFDDIFDEAVKGTDVALTPKETVKQDDREPPPMDASLLDRVREVEGVEAAAGGVFSMVRIVDDKGDPVGAQFAPHFASSVQPKRFESFTYTKGRPPRSASEGALDKATADRADVKVGGRFGVAGDREARKYKLTGIVELGSTSSGGAGYAVLTLEEAQRITDREGKFDQISVAAADGVDPTELKERIAKVAPRTVRVETGQENADRQSQEIADDLSFLKIVLLVFSFVSLFVGGFLILNTFSITVAQRIREFGMLRTLGASQRQVLASVIIEAALVGVIGSVLGLLAGLGFAPAINSLFKNIGVDLPNTGTVLAARTVIVSLAVGIGMTVLSALSPALRATRVSPMAALREAELPEGRRRGRVLAGVALLGVVGGLVLLCVGLFAGIESSGSAAALMGAGAVAVLLGVSIFSPRLVRPLASVTGKPLEAMRGLTGRLARENSMRKPGRTAITAAALMIGLAVVTFVTVFAAGISGSIDKAVDRNIQGDLIVQNLDGFSPIPARIGERLRKVDGVETVSSLNFSAGKVKGVSGEERIAAVDPKSAGDVLTLDWKGGSPDTLAGLGRNDAVIDESWGESNDKDVGDALTVTTPSSKRVSYTIRGSVKDNTDLLGSLVITHQAMKEDFDEDRPAQTFVNFAPGADSKAVRSEIDRLVERDFPSTEALDQTELKDKQAGRINALLGLIYALLSLAVIVSLFGIVNTLALSIFERTRELGMLRAIGMSRRQVRQVVRYEAVITALIGALLGSALGVVFAILVSRPLADEGFTLSIPVATLIILLILAAIAGVVAAIWPARRAAKLNVLEALAYE